MRIIKMQIPILTLIVLQSFAAHKSRARERQKLRLKLKIINNEAASGCFHFECKCTNCWERNNKRRFNANFNNARVSYHMQNISFRFYCVFILISLCENERKPVAGVGWKLVFSWLQFSPSVADRNQKFISLSCCTFLLTTVAPVNYSSFKTDTSGWCISLRGYAGFHWTLLRDLFAMAN